MQANTYPVDVVREGGRWKVCNFFSLSRNPDKPGPLGIPELGLGELLERGYVRGVREHVHE